MKYIIDIPTEMAETIDNRNKLLAPRAFAMTLVPYTEPNRKVIEDEVWEFATICTKMDGADSVDVFGGFSPDSFTKFSYQEAKAKYEEWKKRKDKIKVGDEVILDEVNTKAVVTAKESDDVYYMALTKNGLYEVFKECEVKKTGRHFPEVAQLLEKMRGGEE